MADAPPDSDATPDDEPIPAVKRHWRPVSDTQPRPPATSDAPTPTEQSASPTDASRTDEASAQGDQNPQPTRPPEDKQSAAGRTQDAPAPTGEAIEGNPSPTGETSTERPSDTAPGSAGSSEEMSGDGGPERLDPPPADTTTDDPLDFDNVSNGPPESSSDSSAPDDGAEGDLSPRPDLDDEDDQKAGKQVNEEAFADETDDGSWADRMQNRPDTPPEWDGEDEGFFIDAHRHIPGAEQVEEELQDFAYEMNEGTADTDWTPSEREDRRIASMFARLASKVAEDMSYQRAPGEEFWDPRKIMRRQIDRRPLRHCKMDYTKRRLALLVDTSPSCREEAVFYSKIATGALLRDDIDIFLCPNGRIDAHFDPEPMRFVNDERGTEWALDGRVVLYFTDWDGTDELVKHSRDCTLYWFDNCPPSDYWESEKDRHQRVRLQYCGRHFHCPDPDAFRRLARKIRP